MFEFYDGTKIIMVDNCEKLENLSQEEANNLATGPQDLFFDKLNLINLELLSYGLEPIDVTNKWNWKAGSYDKIRDYLSMKLQLDKKCMSISKLMYRTRDRANYIQYINRQAVSMETERANLKRMGVSKDVDVEVFKETCKTFVENLCKQCENVFESTDGKVLIVPYVKINGRNTDLYYDVTLNDLNLSIYDGKESTKCIQEIPLRPINIIITQSLRHVLNNIKKRKVGFKGFYNQDGPRRQFVYISSGYQNESDERSFYGNVCLDRHHDDVNNSIIKNDLLMFSMHILSWAQYYNMKISNPYNQPYLTHLGMPGNFSEEYKLSCDTKAVTSKCYQELESYGNKLNLTHFDKDNLILATCNNIDCQLKKDCVKNIGITKRQNKMITDFGYQAEGMTGLVVETLLEKYVKNTDINTSGLTDGISYITGESLDLWAYRDLNENGDLISNFDTERTDELIEDMFTRVYWYFIAVLSGEKFCHYTYDFLVKFNLMDEELIVKTENEEPMTTEQIETIMKQWAETQRRQ